MTTRTSRPGLLHLVMPASLPMLRRSVDQVSHSGEGSTGPPSPPTYMGRSVDQALDWGKLVTAEGYHKWMQQRNLSPETVKLWDGVHCRFADWYDHDILKAGSSDIEEWLWEVNPHLAASSRHTYRKALRSYYQWAMRDGLIVADPTDKVPAPKLPTYRPHPMPTELLHKALIAATTTMRALICLGCYQGLRVAEMASLLWADVNHQDITVVGKGRKQRTLPSHPDTLDALWELPRDGPKVMSGMASQTISVTGAAFLRSLGVRSARPMHSLRAWYATELYRASGFDLLLVRDMLGHGSTNTTALYVGLADGAATRAVLKLKVA